MVKWLNGRLVVPVAVGWLNQWLFHLVNYELFKLQTLQTFQTLNSSVNADMSSTMPGCPPKTVILVAD